MTNETNSIISSNSTVSSKDHRKSLSDNDDSGLESDTPTINDGQDYTDNTETERESDDDEEEGEPSSASSNNDLTEDKEQLPVPEVPVVTENAEPIDRVNIPYFTNLYFKIPNPYRHLLYKYSLFGTWVIVGTYTRIGIQKLSDYKPIYISEGTVLWPNVVACICMGMLQELKGPWFSEYPELFLALTTGYCGCVSSYSSFLLELFTYSTDLTAGDVKGHLHWPNRAYGIMEFLSVLILELLVSMASLIFGRRLITDILIHEKYLANFSNKKWRHDMLKYTNFISGIIFLPFIGMLIVLICCYNNYARGKWTIPPFFAIPGAVLRMKLSDWFNGRIATFPIGTFFANEIAVVIICILTLIQRGRRHTGSIAPIAHTFTQCRVVTALISGFCGALSTISTFINEGYKMPLPETLLYYTTSIFISYVFCVLLLGIFSWTRGLTDAVCRT